MHTANISLLPNHVGLDLRAVDAIIALPVGCQSARYIGADGEEAIASGPDMCDVLTNAGYRVIRALNGPWASD